MIRLYTALQGLWLSWYARDFYIDVGARWPGVGFRYVVWLALLTLLPHVITANQALGEFFEQHGETLVAQVPEMDIRNGMLFTNPPEPAIIQDAAGAPVWMIDTSGEVTSLVGREEILLFSRREMVFRFGAQQIRQGYSQLGDRSISAEDIRQSFSFITRFGVWLLLPLNLVLLTSDLFLQVLLYGALGILMAQFYRLGLRYSQAMRLAAVALTPVIIIDALLAWFAIPTQTWRVVALLFAAGFLHFGIESCAAYAVRRERHEGDHDVL